MKKVINPETGEVREVRKVPKRAQAELPRDINEDDDGYHPYSDRVERTPMYEEDPWR